jgi:hypothetical protein
MLTFVRIRDCKCWRVLAATLVLAMGLVVTPAAQAPSEKGRLGIPLTEITKPWTGDSR